MQLRNCVRCGALFGSEGGTLCRECVRQEADEFTVIRRFLEEHPQAELTEVSAETGVSVERLEKLVQEGRLVAMHRDGRYAFSCSICGAAIATGRVCEVCRRELKAPIRPEEPQRTPEPDQPEKRAGRMYTADRFRRRR